MWRGAASAAMVIVSVACGGSDDRPPTPSSPSTVSPATGVAAVPPTGLSLSVTTSATPETSLRVVWSTSQADARPVFTVEVGRAPGSSDFGTFDAGGATSYSVANAPTGRIYVRVRARIGDSVSAPSEEATSNVISIRDAIEALFLLTGPVGLASNTGCSGPRGDRRLGFPVNSMVTLVASTTLSATQMGAVRSFADRIGAFSGGRLSAQVRETSDSAPVPGPNETTIAVGDPTTIGCTTAVSGCAFQRWNGAGIFTSSQVVVRSGTSMGLMLHELGHAVAGMCHVDAAVLGSPAASVMVPAVTTQSFTDLDQTAMRAVFALSEPGASRSQFLAAGLINPQATIASRRVPASVATAGQAAIAD
jgi:hypothetical protein